MTDTRSSRNRADEARTALNGRFLSRSQPTGVDRIAIEVMKRLSSTTSVITPLGSNVAITNLWEQMVLPVRSRNGILVSLANSGPALARGHVTAIHDTAHWDHPEWFSPAYRTKARMLNRCWARTARRILCPSETVGRNITRWLGRDADDITVVGNGHRWGEAPPPNEPAGDAFVLAVGTVSARKNIGALVEAWPLVQRERPDLELRIVGGAGRHTFAGSTDHGGGPSIRYLGYVDDPELDRLFTQASVLVSPSLYEGFNIPILDALTCGTPVVASDIDVHRELFDGACVFSDPTDVPALASAILVASTSSVPSDVSEGLFATHSWANVARRVDEAVERVRDGT